MFQKGGIRCMNFELLWRDVLDRYSQCVSYTDRGTLTMSDYPDPLAFSTRFERGRAFRFEWVLKDALMGAQHGAVWSENDNEWYSRAWFDSQPEQSDDA